MRGGGGSGTGPSPAAAAAPPAVRPPTFRPTLGAVLTARIGRETDPEGLLRLVADELPNFTATNVSFAFCSLGKLCESRHLADDTFRGLMVRVHEMCADRHLELRELSNIMHAVAKMREAGHLATDDAGVEDVLAALEQRVVHEAPKLNSHGVSNFILAFGALGRLPGAAASAALEVAVVRLAPSKHTHEVAHALHVHARLGRAPGDAALAALEVGAYTRPLFLLNLSRFCHQRHPACPRIPHKVLELSRKVDLCQPLALGCGGAGGGGHESREVVKHFIFIREAGADARGRRAGSAGGFGGADGSGHGSPARRSHYVELRDAGADAGS